MSVEFDFHELTEFKARILKNANEQFPKDAKNFIQRAGNALAKSIKAGYKEKTGQFHHNMVRDHKLQWEPNTYGWETIAYTDGMEIYRAVCQGPACCRFCCCSIPAGV